jgi:hypothetical protein
MRERMRDLSHVIVPVLADSVLTVVFVSDHIIARMPCGAAALILSKFEMKVFNSS